MPALPPHVLFGAAYYHEYQPHDRLKTDLDLMVEAEFTHPAFRFHAERVSREILAEFRTAGDLVAGIEPDADVALVFRGRPPVPRPARPAAARLAPEAAARRHPVLIAAGLYLDDDATLDWPAAYAHAGGHLVLGPRTGYADHEARARPEPAPPRLVEAAGVHYDEFSNLSTPLPVRFLDSSGGGTLWIEGLSTVDAEVLATCDHPHFGRWPAIATRAHGAGRVTCVGTVPDRPLARALAAWLVPTPVSGWSDPPESVTASTGTSPDGRRVHVVHNWGATPTSAVVPHDLTDALSGEVVAAQQPLHLGAWDVRVLEAPPHIHP